MTPSPVVLAALAAAALFGASTPLAKLFAGRLSPFLAAGLLYLGSGIGLTLVRWGRDRRLERPRLPPSDWPWLLGAIVAGGIAGPVMLMAGLASTPASTASLLLNLEAVLTAALAWVIFRENADRRIALGMALIVAGGVLLTVSGARATSGFAGSALIAAACLAWAIDNNLTRKVAASDALFIAGFKGLVAGATNLLIAIPGAEWPAAEVVGAVMLVGFLGYGVSLALFVVALRGLGTARTGAYFSTAPFIGVVTSILVLGDVPSPWFWAAGGLMAVGVWLHLTEHHAHEHTHEATEHSHRHVHDEHHHHEHDFDWDGTGPHTHVHRHAARSHSHAHYPDIHHRHDH